MQWFNTKVEKWVSNMNMILSQWSLIVRKDLISVSWRDTLRFSGWNFHDVWLYTALRWVCWWGWVELGIVSTFSRVEIGLWGQVFYLLSGCWWGFSIYNIDTKNKILHACVVFRNDLYVSSHRVTCNWCKWPNE